MKVYFKASVISSYLMGMLMAVMITPGVILIAFDGNVFGFLLIFIWIFLLSISKGTKIDFENKQISFFFSVLWIKFDNWVPVSEFNKFKILNINDSRQYFSRATSTTIHYKKTALDLAIPETRKFKRLAEDDLEEIKTLATRLTEEFKYERIIPPKRPIQKAVR
jgi:hypothetical protein